VDLVFGVQTKKVNGAFGSRLRDELKAGADSVSLWTRIIGRRVRTARTARQFVDDEPR